MEESFSLHQSIKHLMIEDIGEVTSEDGSGDGDAAQLCENQVRDVRVVSTRVV